MFANRFFSSLRATSFFMVGCGLLMGAMFPLYSAIFFGKTAFTPLYVIGCLGAGFLVGIFCFVIIRGVLKTHVEAQWQTLRRFAGEEAAPSGRKRDELQALMECHDTLLERVFAMAGRTSSRVTEISPLCRRLDAASRQMATGNSQQASKEKETLKAVEEMNAFFHDVLKEIEELSVRTDERASISTEMSATTDTIAGNIKDYSASVASTAASMEEMALSIRETTANIEALADSTEQTSSSINEISSAIVNVRDHAQMSADHAEKVRLQAQEGIGAMAATTTAMMEIEASSNDSFSAIKRLVLHTARVGEFLDVIKEVVAQTNLLSLNASIIAAQAGESGKSFAVVAEEVRSLAHRTAASTREIEELVKNMKQETGAVEKAVSAGKEKAAEGVRISARADEALHRIEESAASASAMVRKIASATVEQAAGSRLITEEAQKNLERVKQATRAIQEQERGIGQIVDTLEHMRMVAQKITISTEEQARGNRLYLKSVMEDNDKVKTLRDTSIQQIMMGDVVLNYVREAGALIEANATQTQQALAEIGAISLLTDTLHEELASFRNQDRAV
jgi:methyl-accepting chemotaxis protein